MGAPSAGSVRAAKAAILVGMALLFGVVAAQPQEGGPQEQQVKAAYLYKFGGYVEWPAEAFKEPDSPIVIGVAGDPAMANEVGKVVGNRTVNGRNVEIREIRPGEDIGSPHILFVGKNQLSRLGGVASHRQPILIVTDAANGLEQGSVINFVTTGNRVRFEVSLDAAKRNTLKIAAPLLAVAMKVQ
jgi:hypothetical protein